MGEITYITVAGAFWDTFNYITAPVGLNTQITTIEAFNNSTLQTQINNLNCILDKVYYFIPKETLTPILAVVGAMIVIRIIMSVVNLIWW